MVPLFFLTSSLPPQPASVAAKIIAKKGPLNSCIEKSSPERQTIRPKNGLPHERGIRLESVLDLGDAIVMNPREAIKSDLLNALANALYRAVGHRELHDARMLSAVLKPVIFTG
jgi:hypothetical protein